MQNTIAGIRRSPVPILVMVFPPWCWPEVHNGGGECGWWQQERVEMGSWDVHASLTRRDET
jgi:hypothetical protein